jgi:hypothetical protein
MYCDERNRGRNGAQVQNRFLVRNPCLQMVVKLSTKYSIPELSEETEMRTTSLELLVLCKKS